MEEEKQARLRDEVTGGAVCAHIGLGADNEQAKVARDRLADVLAEYRRAFDKER
ncbi:hypothetical protein GCM10027563_17940 [Parasphingorhabdus pacifica]